MIDGKQSIDRTIQRDEFQSYNGFELDYAYLDFLNKSIRWYLKNGLPTVTLRRPDSPEADVFANVKLTAQEFSEIRQGYLAQKAAVKRALETV